MRCDSCGKMASYNEPQVEVRDTSADGEQVTVEGRMWLTSACCDADLKEWNFTLEGEVNHDTENGEHELTAEADDPTASDFYDGKPGTPARYRKHWYVVTCSVNVTCSCGFETSVELSDQNQASAFDELT